MVGSKGEERGFAVGRVVVPGLGVCARAFCARLALRVRAWHRLVRVEGGCLFIRVEPWVRGCVGGCAARICGPIRGMGGAPSKELASGLACGFAMADLVCGSEEAGIGRAGRGDGGELGCGAGAGERDDVALAAAGEAAEPAEDGAGGWAVEEVEDLVEGEGEGAGDLGEGECAFEVELEEVVRVLLRDGRGLRTARLPMRRG